MSIFLIKALQLILALTILVTIHELGHFLFARLFKIRVDKFYIFFDPWWSLFKFKPKGSHTEYGIGWLPLGGYCKIAGMIDESMDTSGLTKEPEDWEFRAKPAWQRLLVMAGGVIFNIILAIIIYTGISYHWGDTKIPMENIGNNLVYSQVGHQMGLEDGDIPIAVDGHKLKYFDEGNLMTIVDGKELSIDRNGKTKTILIPIDLMKHIMASKEPLFTLKVPAIIEKTLAGSQSEKAGLQSSDRILGTDSLALGSVNTLIGFIQSHKGDSITLNILRGGKALAVRLLVDKEKGIGVQFKNPNEIFATQKINYNVVDAVPAGIDRAYHKLTSYASSLKYVATKEGVKQLGGLGTIGSLFPKTFDWFSFWNMTAFLSIILAVMNILPIPGLDGGHIVFLLVEMITRRKPSIKVQEYIQIVGITLLFALMIYANLNDIIRYFF